MCPFSNLNEQHAHIHLNRAFLLQLKDGERKGISPFAPLNKSELDRRTVQEEDEASFNIYIVDTLGVAIP